LDIPILLFLMSGGFIAYVLALYPLAQARRPLRSAGDAPGTAGPRPVSVIVAVHNGEAWIRGKLESILKSDYPAECLQVLVVSDGSTDRTEEIAREFASVEVVAAPRGGKAAALNAGIARAPGWRTLPWES
jgi:cellulose synthase/poly-beta-1,6-N-acetylglucosamine synthase-like glycosyltransferase